MQIHNPQTHPPTHSHTHTHTHTHNQTDINKTQYKYSNQFTHTHTHTHTHTQSEHTYTWKTTHMSVTPWPLEPNKNNTTRSEHTCLSETTHRPITAGSTQCHSGQGDTADAQRDEPPRGRSAGYSCDPHPDPCTLPVCLFPAPLTRQWCGCDRSPCPWVQLPATIATVVRAFICMYQYAVLTTATKSATRCQHN